MTTQELHDLPVTVDLVTAGRALGIGRSQVYRLNELGELPFRVLKVGGRFRVPKHDLLRVLGEGDTK